MMTFWNLDNHLVAFMGMEMVVCQLLVCDCSEHEYVRINHNGCLIIPRGVQFGKELFPKMVVPRNHAAPYPDPTTGKEAHFITDGNFQQHGHHLPRHVAGDFLLYTTEVVHLRGVGVVKPSAAPSLSISTLSTLAYMAQIQSAPATPGLPKVNPGSPRVEPDLSSKRWEDTSSSKGHKHQVSAATGSSTLHWKSPMSRTMTRTAKGTRKTKYVIKITKGAGNVQTRPWPSKAQKLTL